MNIKESRRINKYLNFVKELKTEYESDSDTNCTWCSRNGPRRPGKETGEIEDQRKNRDRPFRLQRC